MKFVIGKKIILILFLFSSFQAQSSCIFNSVNWIAEINGVEIVSSMRGERYTATKGSFVEKKEIDGRKIAKGMITNTFLKPLVKMAKEGKFYQICYKLKEAKK